MGTLLKEVYEWTPLGKNIEVFFHTVGNYNRNDGSFYAIDVINHDKDMFLIQLCFDSLREARKKYKETVIEMRKRFGVACVAN